MGPRKNLTIAVDEDVARWARVWAANRDTSVSRLLGDLLRQRMLDDLRYEDSMRDYLSRRPSAISDGSPYPTREDVHDRRRVR
jgi:hypothetical protein